MASLSILEALDNLNALIDAESIEQLEVADGQQLIAHFEPKEGDYWVRAGADEMTCDAIRETFKAVHDYLVHFYEKARAQHKETKHLMEGINSVMVLVGEAANKLEREHAIFKKTVLELPEYRELQDFYKQRVVRELFIDLAKVPTIKPVEEEEIEEIEGVHLLNDIDVIRRDHLYELFLLKNEAGQDFYTPALSRKLKLACDFGHYMDQLTGDDPFIQIKSWEDRTLHLFARRILNSIKKELALFYSNRGSSHEEIEIVKWVHQAVMALLLAANPRNLLRQFAPKGCYLYFNDFQLFLRQAVRTREYQHLCLYPGKDTLSICSVQLIQSMLLAFFSLGTESQEALSLITKWVGKTRGGYADQLHHAWKQLETAFSLHPNGPILKALDLVREDSEHFFDPVIQGNMPTIECSLTQGTVLLKMAAPIYQHTIHQAEVIDEFKAYLHITRDKHLIINYQDSSSWRERARAEVIEELGRYATTADHLTVVTLSKDTEFYDQSGPYEGLTDAVEFIQQCMEQLQNNKAGFSFPPTLHALLFPAWTSQMLHHIHRIFFDHKPKLTTEERTDFITLIYNIIELKLIEILNPSKVIHLSKDGLDASATASASFIAFLQVDRGYSEKLFQQLLSLLFVPTMLQRERTPHPERMERLLSFMRRLEAHPSYRSELSNLFAHSTLNISVLDS